MIPTLQHTQPLLKDLSIQPDGRYLLTVYGATSRKYLYIDEVVVQESYMEAYRCGVSYPIITLPTGTIWTVVASTCLEFPTLEEVSRQTKQDADHMKLLGQELYPNGNEEKGTPLPTVGRIIFASGAPETAGDPATGQYL